VTTLTHHNARLKAVKDRGFSKNYGRPAGAGQAKWSGDAEAFVYTELVASTTGGELDQLEETRIAIPSNLGIPVEPGDTVEYLMDGITSPATVRTVVTPPFLGITRLHLVDR
jgi:hypothetical protein